MKWTPIPQEKEDPNVMSAAWENGELYIRFHSLNPVLGVHRVYLYHSVALSTFEELVQSDDPDQYHHDRIKPHPYVEVTGIPLF